MSEIGRDDYLDMMLARWRKVTAQIKELESQREKLAELILAEPDMVTGTKRSGVQVLTQHRFSPNKAKEVLTQEDYDAICEQVPSARKAESLLDPEVFEMLKVRSGRRFLRTAAEETPAP